MTEKLMPCPFCGSSDAFVEQSTFASSYVICNNCSARGPDACQDSDDEDEPGRDNAITAWNTRHPTPAADEVEAVARAIHRARFPETYTAHEDYWQQLSDGGREKWFHVARAAIAALQDRSAEHDVIARLTAEAEAHPHTNWALSLNAVIYFLREGRPAEPAGEEPHKALPDLSDEDHPAWIVKTALEEAYRVEWVDVDADGAVRFLDSEAQGGAVEHRIDFTRPTTQTNPERLVEIARHVASLRALATWIMENDHDMNGLRDLGEVLDPEETADLLAALSAAPLKEGKE